MTKEAKHKILFPITAAFHLVSSPLWFNDVSIHRNTQKLWPDKRN